MIAGAPAGCLKGHGGALVLKAPRLEAHDEGEEIVIWDGRGGVGEGALIGQGASLVLNAGTLSMKERATGKLLPHIKEKAKT